MRRVFPLFALAALAAPVAGQPAPVSPDSIRAPMKTLDFTTTEGTWISVDVSPDGRTIAFDLLGTIYEMPFAGGEARAITRGRAYNQFPRYSPDGTRILFTSDRTGREEVWVLHRAADSLEKISRHDYRAFQGNWSRDGRFVYHAAMDLGAKYSAFRIDGMGSRTEFAAGGVFAPPTQLNEGVDGKVYFSQPAGQLYQTGFQIKTYDLKTGEIAVYRTRPGGAADPRLSPDGKSLAYIHRDDRRTVLVVHDLASQSERVVKAGLDRDRMESGAGTTFGIYPNFAWTPNGREIVIAYGGTIHAIDVATGAERSIPFRARVERQLAETIRFPVPIPASGTAKSRSHRWGQRTDQGVLYEALGDLYLKGQAAAVNLTGSRAFESSPTYDPRTRTVYYASWSDDSLGAVWSLSLAAPAPRRPTRLTTRPTQYGGLSLSPDGRTLAYLRGGDGLNHGDDLEGQEEFDLVTRGPDGQERVVTSVEWKATNPLAVRNPPAIDFNPDGSVLYFTELVRDTLRLKSIRPDGMDERTLYYFPHGARATVSPDGRWIAFREYFRTFLTPFAYAGKPLTISSFDKQGIAFRVSQEDGEYLTWSPDSRTLTWTRGTDFFEKDVADVVAGRSAMKRTDLTVDYPVAAPSGVVALTNARVITVDAGRRILDRATIVIRGNLIEAVGPDVAVPAGARVFDLAGKTVMPGMIDAHGHYGPDISTLNVLEQNPIGLRANLAYGTTTLYEVYGDHVKDFLASDLQRSGAIAGSRLLSVGPPIYGLRYYRPKSYRPILSQADADDVVAFNKAYGATALKDYVQFTRGARIQLYDAARRMGVNVVAETAVDFQMNWTMLMDGVSGLEHTVGLTPLYRDVHELWKATGAGNTPTLIVVYNGPQGEGLFHQDERLWEDEKLLRFFPKEYLIRFRRPTRYFSDDTYATEMARELRKLAQSGVSLQISGHGQMHGLDKHWEMELLSRGGFTPAEIIATATINSAKYLGLDRQLGSIETGKLADLVVLNANPLDDIRNSRSIEYVVQNGVVYRGADASRVYPNPEPAGKQYWFRGSVGGSAQIDRDPWSR